HVRDAGDRLILIYLVSGAGRSESELAAGSPDAREQLFHARKRLHLPKIVSLEEGRPVLFDLLSLGLRYSWYEGRDQKVGTFSDVPAHIFHTDPYAKPSEGFHP